LALPDLGRAFRQVSFWRSAREPTERMNSALPFCPSLIQPTVGMNSAQWLRPKYRRYLTTEWLLTERPPAIRCSLWGAASKCRQPKPAPTP
jgi:hypothetical protein